MKSKIVGLYKSAKKLDKSHKIILIAVICLSLITTTAALASTYQTKKPAPEKTTQPKQTPTPKVDATNTQPDTPPTPTPDTNRPPANTPQANPPAQSNPTPTPQTAQQTSLPPRDNSTALPAGRVATSLSLYIQHSGRSLSFSGSALPSSNYAFWVRPIKTQNSLGEIFTTSYMRMYSAQSGIGNPEVPNSSVGDEFLVAVCILENGTCGFTSNSVHMTLVADYYAQVPIYSAN